MIIPTPAAACRNAALLFVTALLSLACVPSIGAAPNTTSLAGFSGNFEGSATVAGTNVSQELKGKDKLQFKVPASGLRGTLKIKAYVRVDGNKVPLDNVIKFSSNGTVKVDEVAPGVTDKFKTKGEFTATTAKITFTCAFESGTSVGAINGTIDLVKKANRTTLTIVYNVSLDGAAPIYIYTYTGSRKN